MQDFIKEKKAYFILLGAVLLIGGAIYYHQHKNDQALVLEEDGEENTLEALSSSSDEVDFTIDQETKTIMVHIVGQVKTPGVLNILEGSRLTEAIDQLGGPTAEADLDAVNLAQKLRDEEKIYIPKIGEIPDENLLSRSSISDQEGLININTASLEQLKTLSGIGDVIGGNIIEYRESHQGFKSKEEIKQVNRIGEKIYQEIQDKIQI